MASKWKSLSGIGLTTGKLKIAHPDFMDKCKYCHNTVPLSADRCPHCARPGLFPNVRAAQHGVEETTLETRYNHAIERAKLRGCRSMALGFQKAIEKSQAVINRPLAEVQRLAMNDEELYATYYQLTDSGVKAANSDIWDKRRRVADEALFPGYKEAIRFGALSIDGMGLWHYGECNLVLRNDMIAHRASVFEENSVMFMKHHDIRVYEVDKLPPGYKPTWEKRDRLCAAKLADKISDATLAEDFPSILLKNGSSPEKDDFVEVHIWGPLSRRTLSRVTIKAESRRKADKVRIRALRQKLLEAKVPLEVLS